MKTNWMIIETEWQDKYAKLESDKELHRISFIMTKKCNCKTDECKHYEAEKIELFERRINELLAERIKINSSAVENIILKPEP